MMNFIKKYGRLVISANSHIYHLSRFVKYSNWAGDIEKKENRNYHAVKVYHSLEKSLSFREQRQESGWGNAREMLRIWEAAARNDNIGYHDQAGVKVLSDFIKSKENTSADSDDKNYDDVHLAAEHIPTDVGVKTVTEQDLKKGMLSSPEDFFLSRYSLRDFKPDSIPEEELLRAIELVKKTPSVCNRQEWKIYHTSDRSVIKEALKHQSGNKGFGHLVPNLIIVSIDLRAFIQGQEHYQQWIDGGMLSMSIVYSLHSLGIGSCCLNWSQKPKIEKQLRKSLNIENHNSVIMMIACGYPNNTNAVCVSPRVPTSYIHETLQLRRKKK